VRPLDPRLVRQAGAARGFLAGTVVSGLVMTGLVLAQAGLLAHVIAHASLGVRALSASLIALGLVVIARAAVAYGGEALALRAAAATKSQLRRKLLRRIMDLGPQWLGRRSHGELVTLAGRGLDALDPYFARYLPQLVLSAIVPVAVLARIAGADLASAVTIAVTLPLIPIFMALIGWHTQARTQRQWKLLTRLGGHFLDVVEGLPTLKAFGRAKAQAQTIRRVTEEHRHATMATLRITFLSSLVLELIATLSTALVAVEVGLRLLSGNLGYESALLVLLLAPEVYLPLRSVGSQFHAAAEGVAAAADVLDVLDEQLAGEPDPASALPAHRVDLRSEPIRFDRVTVRYPDRSDAALEELCVSLHPGEHVAVVGPSGAGKSTMLALILGFTQATEGAVRIGGIALRDLDPGGMAGLRGQIAWVPQNAHLFGGSIADNIRLGAPGADGQAVALAAERAGLAAMLADLPAGVDSPVGERGHRLSTGQRQRVAIARALLRDPALLLLDEPGAHLDAETAEEVIAGISGFGARRTLIVVTHDPAWAAGADRVLRLEGGRLVTPMRGTDVSAMNDRRLSPAGAGGAR
jgi:ATP-binding cassette, subfamily C, bacterial CydD